MQSKVLLIFLCFILTSCPSPKGTVVDTNRNIKNDDEQTQSTDTNTNNNSNQDTSSSNNNNQNNGGNSNSDDPPTFDDPLKSYAWHLENTGQETFSESGGTVGSDLNVKDVWEQNVLGSGVLIAVSDNAVEVSHEDLGGNALLGSHRNYHLSSPYTGDPSPSSGQSAHGTAVTGIISASGNNSKGSLGIAPLSSFSAFRYIGSTSSVSKQVHQANGIQDIFNFSYGAYSCIFSPVSSTYISQLKYGVESLRGGLGAIYVKAGGNEYLSTSEDCFPDEDEADRTYYLGNATLEEDHSYPYVIVTAALNSNGTSAFYSNPGSAVWVSAPGGDYGTSSPAILTTDISGCSEGYSKSSATQNAFEKGGEPNANCNYTSVMNGTSSSTPMVSGVVALMLSANPSLTWRDVKYILAKTAKKVDASRSALTNHPLGENLSGHTYLESWTTNAAGFHFHNWYGFGGVDALAAVNLAKSYSSSFGTFKEIEVNSGSVNIDIPDNSSTGAKSYLNYNSSTTIEAVQITLDVEHSYIGDLGVELISPSGTKSQLMLINSGARGTNINNEVLLSNAFFGENASGTWELKVIDGYANDVGKIKSWKLKVYGH
ncbi:MAG: S8 family peptidase [Bacteriovoracaceae bacterium]